MLCTPTLATRRTDPADEIHDDCLDGPAVTQASRPMAPRQSIVCSAAMHEIPTTSLACSAANAPTWGSSIRRITLLSRGIGGRGRVKHREFAMASGEMSRDEFIAFLKATLGAAANVSVDGAVHFVCMDWRHVEELVDRRPAASTARCSI